MEAVRIHSETLLSPLAFMLPGIAPASSTASADPIRSDRVAAWRL
jgi:hypothetical protein